MNAMDGGVGGLSLITTAIHVQRTYFQHMCTVLDSLLMTQLPMKEGPLCSTSGVLKLFGLWTPILYS